MDTASHGYPSSMKSGSLYLSR